MGAVFSFQFEVWSFRLQFSASIIQLLDYFQFCILHIQFFYFQLSRLKFELSVFPLSNRKFDANQLDSLCFSNHPFFLQLPLAPTECLHKSTSTTSRTTILERVQKNDLHAILCLIFEEPSPCTNERCNAGCEEKKNEKRFSPHLLEFSLLGGKSSENWC